MKYMQWLADDFTVIIHGIGGLVVLIAGGVLLAERAIVDLTHCQQQLVFVNLQVTSLGVYTFYFLGESIMLHSLLHIGKIGSLGCKLLLEIGSTTFVINTLPVFAASDLFTWLGMWIMNAKHGAFVLLAAVGDGLIKVWLWLADYARDFF